MPLLALVRTAASLSSSITAPFQRRASLLFSRELLQKMCLPTPKSTDTRRNIIDVSVKTRPGSFGTCAPTARAKKDCERLVQLADQDLSLRSVRIIQAKNSACNALGASSSSGGSRSPISVRTPVDSSCDDAVRPSQAYVSFLHKTSQRSCGHLMT